MTLPYRLFVANTAGACLLIWCYWLGYIARVTEGDIAHMAEIMAGLFLIGLISTFRIAFKVEAIRDRADYTANGRLKSIRALMIKSKHLIVFSSTLFILSIIGNAIGIKAMFHGIDPSVLASPDVGAKLGLQVMGGASMTFGSTIIGASLHIWTILNAMMLYTEMSLLELEAM
ncbi:hypothetical protein [Mesorhizobium sp. Root172]|uniref:hypothetical protein n=1 Tax=Mesorhizobium sp. Root172 TaxID=1736481 RepID=UPI0006F5EC9F|nr:hypothetical protein [Mesorhizobium sp. Root172]KRB22660.1 hypothetical protein ASE05_15865 [Mesorhizobium sp. Root172]